MKSLRLFLGLWLAAAISGCSLFPGFPSAPSEGTPIPGITSTSIAPSIPTDTPTPIPVVRIENGEHALFNGDYPTALLHFQTVYKDSSDPVLRAAAKWGEARVFHAQGRYSEAASSLQTLIAEFPNSIHVAQAYFLLGSSQYELKQYAEAAASWQIYLLVRPGVLDSYTQELRGDALFAAQNYSDALTAYSAAVQAPRLGDTILVDLKIAQTRAELGDAETALATYDNIIALAGNNFVKAQAAYQAGELYQELGRSEEAFAKYRLAVENYQQSYYSYLSLVKLVEAGVEVNDLDRGLVDYFAGQYDVAIQAFDRFIAAHPINDGTALYYRALSFRNLGNYDAAVEGLTAFIGSYPDHPSWHDAWGEKAFIQWYNLGLYQIAAQTLLDYAAAAPNSSYTVDYLMSAARIYERDNRLAEAAQTWSRVANEYPSSSQASDAIFLAGIVQYRQNDFNSALTSFGRSLVLSVSPEDLARAYLWIGKTQQKLGDAGGAVSSWQKGQAIDPGGYYSERSRDLLLERLPFAPASSSNLNHNLLEERKDADAWVRLTFNLPPETDLSGAGTLAADPRFIRGTEFWQLGLFDEARLEFEDLRAAVNANAVDSYRLANYLLDLGLYRSAIFAARQTLTLAGLDDHSESMMAPPYFSHLRYGLYYSELVIPYAQAEGFDPLFLFSVIRQESLFEGFVRSTAGARGLMQIIPSTGANIAAEINWPPQYSEEDLYRPEVSLRLGIHYLAKNRNSLGGDLYAALAAYNGGPVNAVIWKQLAGDDPDLFLETVRFEETRNYIRNIYEIYVIYRRLYSLDNP